MNQLDFLELTNKLEKNFDKKYSEDQLKIMYENLKKLDLDRYKLIIDKLIREKKFLPKLNEILDTNVSIGFYQKHEVKDCPICGGTGYLIYKKEINGHLYDYGALCECGNAPEYKGEQFYIKHYAEIIGV